LALPRWCSGCGLPLGSIGIFNLAEDSRGDRHDTTRLRAPYTHPCRELKLSPSIVTLSKPGTYAFKTENKGSAEHSLEIDGKDVKSKGGEVGEAKLEQTLNPGQSGVLTVSFQATGTCEMCCPVIGHRLAGIRAR
jgi:hypothetical protein